MSPGALVPILVDDRVIRLPKLTPTLFFTVPYFQDVVQIAPIGRRGSVPRGQSYYRIDFQRYRGFEPPPMEVISVALNKRPVGARVYVQLPNDEATADPERRWVSDFFVGRWVLCTVCSPDPTGPTPEEKAAKKEAYKARQHSRRKTAWEKLLDDEGES